MYEAKRKNRTVWLSIIALVVIMGVLYLMLKHAPQAKQDLATPREPSPALQTPVQSTSTSTATMTPTAKLQATPTLIGLSVLPAPTIGVTQIPPIVQSLTEQDDTYLYEDVIVTLSFNLATSYRTLAKAYLNLDDLENNGFTNSDVLIFASTGSGGTTFGLAPANLAIDYPGQAEMNYASCVDHLNEFGNYDEPETRMSYCVRTDEGRIGIIQYLPGSDQVDDIVWKRSYRITVYSQKIDE